MSELTELVIWLLRVCSLSKAIIKSSNNYFYNLFRSVNQNKNSSTFVDSRIGLDEWSNYVKMFGLGSNLNFNISTTNSGFIPLKIIQYLLWY